MNKIQKIIISIWFIPSFVIVVTGIAFLFSDEGKAYWYNDIGMTLLCLIILGIPTLFLYKLWADKK